MREVKIPMRNSGYYRMFMREISYREACYHCEYASLDKPADITIGDYFEAKEDYPELFSGDEAIECSGGISCVIVQSEKGMELIKRAVDYLSLYEVDPEVVKASHKQLRTPPACSKLRVKLLHLYKRKGYKAVEYYWKIRNIVCAIPRAIILMLKKVFR